MNQFNTKRATLGLDVLRVIFIIITILASSCGGVVGNIKKYDYRLSIRELEDKIDLVIKNKPEYNSVDIENIYKVRENASLKKINFIVVNNNKDKLVFGFKPVAIGNKSQLALIYAAPLGEVFVLPANMPLFDKFKYSRVFQNSFLKDLDNYL